MQTLHVKRVSNRGIHGEYPALQNIHTGAVYVDITLGIERHLIADANGENRSGEFVAFNIPGAWHSYQQEPECPLRREITFILHET